MLSEKSGGAQEQAASVKLISKFTSFGRLSHIGMIKENQTVDFPLFI